MIQESILIEIRKDFKTGRYEDARRKADLLFSSHYDSSYRIASDICSVAYEHFYILVNNGGRETANRLVEMFPECGFHHWINYFLREKKRTSKSQS